ncbi:MAG TPA: sigma-70 family RNA polymerase sigma factor [Acidimicrobiales bacterium]|nr:sigma-70 family RNA polymerase sigma factor [Acidimicrobiales bacterium]
MEEIESLVSRAAQGDAEAWSDLVKRFGGLIWHIARCAGLDLPDAADVSQTTWLRFAENLSALREPGRAGAWLATTARRESAKVARLAGRQVVVDPWSELRRVEDQEPAADVAMIDEEESIAVQLAVAQLPARCRELLLGLVGDPPCSYSELSAKLGLPIGSIGPTRARCLERLRELLAEKATQVDEVAIGQTIR